MAASVPHKATWRQISLRGLLLATIVAGVVMAVYRHESRRYEQELRIVQQLRWKLRGNSVA